MLENVPNEERKEENRDINLYLFVNQLQIAPSSRRTYFLTCLGELATARNARFPETPRVCKIKKRLAEASSATTVAQAPIWTLEEIVKKCPKEVQATAVICTLVCARMGNLDGFQTKRLTESETHFQWCIVWTKHKTMGQTGAKEVNLSVPKTDTTRIAHNKLVKGPITESDKKHLEAFFEKNHMQKHALRRSGLNFWRSLGLDIVALNEDIASYNGRKFHGVHRRHGLIGALNYGYNEAGGLYGVSATHYAHVQKGAGGKSSLPDYSSPLYTPSTKKLNFEQVKQIAGEATEKIAPWLTDEKHYNDLLRSGRARLSRARVKNKAPVSDVVQIIKAGIMEKVAPEQQGNSRAFVHLKTVNERKKKRRRLILETRELNKCIKKNKKRWLQKMHLPSHREIELQARKARYIEAFDFKSFYYQISLAPEIRKFFRVWINNELYQLCVLPMGSCFSAHVAQWISTECTKKLSAQGADEDESSATYIDNIYFFSDKKQERKIPENFPEIGSHEEGTKMVVLGRKIDLTEQTIDISDGLRADLKTELALLEISVAAFSFRNFLQSWGRIIFCSQILHATLATMYKSMRDLARVCRDFIKGKIDLDGIIQKGTGENHKKTLEKAIEWKPIKFQQTKSTAQKNCVVISDASEKRSAYIIVSNTEETRMESWENVKKQHINMTEAEAGLEGIKKAVELGYQYITWLTDSQVARYTALKGHAKNEEMNKIVESLMQVDAWIRCEWISTTENAADEPSRGKEIDEEKLQKNVKEWKRNPSSERSTWWFGSRWRGGGETPSESDA